MKTPPRPEMPGDLSTLSLDNIDLFQTLFDQSPFSMQIFSIDGTTIQVNSAWEKLWQAKKDDAVGKYNILMDEQASALGISSQFKQVLLGRSVDIEDIYFDPAVSGFPGRSRWIRARMYPLTETDGTVSGVVRINEDITRIKEQEDKYKSLVDFSTEAIFVLQKGNQSPPHHTVIVNEHHFYRFRFIHHLLSPYLPKPLQSGHLHQAGWRFAAQHQPIRRAPA